MNTIMKRTHLSTNIAILSATVAFTVLADTTKADMINRSADQAHQSMGDENMHSTKDSRYSEPKMKNAWLEGKLEVALLLNRDLNNFTIDSEINSGKAVLSGTVESKIDRELAEQVALSIDGIERSFSQKMEDMITTALLKSKLLSNGSTHCLIINVDTLNGVVSLKGDVTTDEEKQLVEALADNTDGVVDVMNLLTVSP